MSHTGTTEQLLALALDGDDQACVEHFGVPRRQVIRRVLKLVEDPQVALAHPRLAQRVRERVAVQAEARSARRLRAV